MSDDQITFAEAKRLWESMAPENRKMPNYEVIICEEIDLLRDDSYTIRLAVRESYTLTINSYTLARALEPDYLATLNERWKLGLTVADVQMLLEERKKWRTTIQENL